jgi:hypothetical protein
VQITADGSADCPKGWSCRQFVVGCPEVREAARGEIAVRAATGAPRGMVVFYSGADGKDWWSVGERFTDPFFGRLLDGGLSLVQVRWVDSWIVSTRGEDAGVMRLACRPASTIRWIHDHLYAAPASPAATGRCGFCVTGNSGGSSQISYAPAYYGLSDVVDGLFPTSGPGFADITKGCLGTDPAYAYGDTEAATGIDASYGYAPGAGPCARHDRAYVARWQRDSVDGSGTYRYARTRVEVIVGGADDTSAPAHARDYVARLRAAGQTVALNAIPGAPHRIQSSPDGLAALSTALLGG